MITFLICFFALIEKLSQVSEALRVITSETERASLENLRCDLQEILDLTRETLNEMKGNTNTEDDAQNDDNEDDPYAQEMALFMAQINDSQPNFSNEAQQLVKDEEVEKFKVSNRKHSN